MNISINYHSTILLPYLLIPHRLDSFQKNEAQHQVLSHLYYHLHYYQKAGKLRGILLFARG